MWDALLANLDDEDREHAKRRVWQSIEDDRARARTSDDGPYETAHEEGEPADDDG